MLNITPEMSGPDQDSHHLLVWALGTDHIGSSQDTLAEVRISILRLL